MTSDDKINVELLKRRLSELEFRPVPELKSGGGDGTSDGMSQLHDIDVRLAKLEGGNGMLQFAVGVVSAALLAGMAILVGVQMNTQQQVAGLSAKVDQLPGEINSNLLELSSALSLTASAARQTAETPAPVTLDRSAIDLLLGPDRHLDLSAPPLELRPQLAPGEPPTTAN
ncbi:hypothetical protein [Devosia beringensis]|uniref:hypothetical protein n=1 Tax=Devosia beringensis TaxID=2657486 RepID=UPI00186B7BFC|nr:hypothetical protein [Devosia beringensis]